MIMVLAQVTARILIPSPDLDGILALVVDTWADLQRSPSASALLKPEAIAGLWYGALLLACAAYTNRDALTTLPAGALWLHPIDRTQMADALLRLARRINPGVDLDPARVTLGLPGNDPSVPRRMLAIDARRARHRASRS